MSVADELQKLEQLRQAGTIDEAEFAAAKARVLNSPQPAAPLFGTWNSTPAEPASQEQRTRLWGLALHLSLFAGYAVPLAGFVAPIVIWQLKKDELPDLDAHGRNAVNWIISHVIYVAASFVLAFVGIGIPLLIVLGVLGVVFPIVAAIKAHNGETWKYPMSISFL